MDRATLEVLRIRISHRHPKSDNMFHSVLLHLDNFGWPAFCFENWPNLSYDLPTVVKVFALKPLTQEHSDGKVLFVFT